MRHLTTAIAIALSAPAAAAAADLTVRVGGLRSAQGQVLVAVCDEARFTTAGCVHVGAAPAGEGTVTVRDIPPGTYAVQAIHDENGNGTLDRRLRLMPLEGIGFSRDAPMRRGPPRFADAAIDINGDGTIALDMRYFR